MFTQENCTEIEVTFNTSLIVMDTFTSNMAQIENIDRFIHTFLFHKEEFCCSLISPNHKTF